jgi:hypothetical protein
MTTQTDELLYDVKDKIATLTLNRPEKMNAFTGPMIDRWAWALRGMRSPREAIAERRADNRSPTRQIGRRSTSSTLSLTPSMRSPDSPRVWRSRRSRRSRRVCSAHDHDDRDARSWRRKHRLEARRQQRIVAAARSRALACCARAIVRSARHSNTR